METLFSGLSENACRAIVGASLWNRAGLSWYAQDRIIESAQGTDASAGRRVIWVYRAPWSLVDQVSDAGSTSIGDLLADWLASNRAALNLRRRLGKNLRFVNADNVSYADLRATLDSSASAPDAVPVPAEGGAIVGRLFEWIAPEYWEVFQSLEGASWLPRQEPAFGGGPAPDEHRLFALLARLRDAASLPVVRAEFEVQKQHLEEAHKQHLEASKCELTELRQECELQLQQLHQVQEELEQYYLKNIELIPAANESKALRLQLEDMQAQLNRHLRAPVDPTTVRAQNGFLRGNPVSRWAIGLARRLLGRSNGSNVVPPELISIRNSEWFDREWYLHNYPDVRAANMDPAEHYFNLGWQESRNPSASFDTNYYLASNPDVADSGLNPLWHFISHGCDEGRRPRRS